MWNQTRVVSGVGEWKSINPPPPPELNREAGVPPPGFLQSHFSFKL